jgi:hypothetical protein
VSERLAAVAPGATATVVLLDTRAGKVRSWVVDRPSDGATWQTAPVPGTAAPARSVLLGPLVAPPGSGGAQATLVLAAPEGDTSARVRLVTASGGNTASPAGLDDVPVPGGEAVAVPVTLPRGEGVAVLVDASGGAPLVAGLGLPTGATTASSAGQDLATTWVAGVPVTATASEINQTRAPMIDVPPVPAGAAGALVLVAPNGTGSVRLDGHPLTVPAGGAVTVALPAGYAGGDLTVLTGAIGVAEELGTPAEGTDGSAITPADLPEPEVTDLAPLATVSSVLPLQVADPVGPAALVEDPAAG